MEKTEMNFAECKVKQERIDYEELEDPLKMDPSDKLENGVKAEVESEEGGHLAAVPSIILKTIKTECDDIQSSSDTSTKTLIGTKQVKPEVETDERAASRKGGSAKSAREKLSNPYICNICAKQFRTIRALQIHRRAHTGEQQYSCETCDKEFLNEENLNIHMELHNKTKRFRCQVCSKMFTSSHYLKNHTLAHSGEQRFECQICHKKFITSSGLNTHALVHTKDKKFHCDICNKGFSSRGSHYTHSLRHAADKRFECRVCGDKFAFHTHLKEHALTHVDP